MRIRSTLSRLFAVVAFTLLFLCNPAPTHAAQLDPGGGWSAPTVIWPEGWDNPMYFDMDDNGTRMVALIPYAGADKDHRPIQVSEFVDDAWQTPVTIATNGSFSTENFQVLPQKTTPVISGNGETIAYTGWTGTMYGVYIVDRVGAGWGAPVLLSTGLQNHHYWVSLSDDGDTVAYSSYSFLEGSSLYVSSRGEPGQPWGGAVQISTPNLGGGWGSLSGDGAKIAFVSNAQLDFSEKIGSTWTPPASLTDNFWFEASVEFPQMSGDGQSIFYWEVGLTPGSGNYVRSGQNLYVIRRSGTGWSAPQVVNAIPILPTSVVDGPAAADEHATRLIYTRPITTTDSGSSDPYVYGSQLEVSEWRDGGWQSRLLVDMAGWGNYNWWPKLSPDGLRLAFDGNQRDQRYGTLWQMTTPNAPPPAPAAPVMVSALIAPTGGGLTSPTDHTSYLFGAGTFTDTVRVDHVVEPTLPHPAPAGMAGIGHCFWVAAILNATGEMAQPGVPVTVTIDYGDTGRGPTLPGTLDLWRWDEEAEIWTLDAITCQDDAANQRMTCQVSHFSTFALLGETRSVFLPSVRR